ncbi:MAG: hypothetical protein HFI03_05820 [Lachnospiraceae bacterium]|nr:hypothetical protein [Lachnospiraceae bacterium]
MRIIKCLFWNLNKKNLVQELMEIVLENNSDIIMAVEAENLDTQYLLSGLRRQGKVFDKKEMLPKGNGMMLFAAESIAISVYREEKYFAAYKVHENGKNRLLVMVHLTSAMYCGEFGRNQRANDLSKTISKLEEFCNIEAEKAGEEKYDTIVAGDFNLHPFSAGMIGMHGFNAVMDPNRALKESRTWNGNKLKFYYNPMWNLMGKWDKVLGTYYFEHDQDDNSFYWYTFDQVLIRPELIDSFVWDEFGIVDHVEKASLLKNNKIYNTKYSDHLPIKFAIS